MKEFEDFTAAVEKQFSAVSSLNSASDALSSTTSDLASKGDALKAAIDVAVANASRSADVAKASAAGLTVPALFGGDSPSANGTATGALQPTTPTTEAIPAGTAEIQGQD